MPWLVNAHAVLPEVGSVDPAINVWPITNGSCIIKAAEAALKNINHASIGAIALQVQVKQFSCEQFKLHRQGCDEHHNGCGARQDACPKYMSCSFRLLLCLLHLSFQTEVNK
eukprot:2641792-Amphidinium_carterae.1